MLIYDDTNAMERCEGLRPGVEFKDPQTFSEFTLTYRTGDIVSSAREQRRSPWGSRWTLPRMRANRSDAAGPTASRACAWCACSRQSSGAGGNGNRLERIDWGRAGTGVDRALDGASACGGDRDARPPGFRPLRQNGAMAASRGTDS
jgi:hypothetical protein